MKKIMCLFFLLLSGLIMAQTFDSFEEAMEHQVPYHPVATNGFLPLSSEEDTTSFTGVFHGLTAGGKIKFVWLKNELVITKNGRIIGIYSCRNKGIFYPQTQKSLAFKNGINGRDGINGINGRDGRDGQIPPITIINEAGFPWGMVIIGGVTVITLVLIYFIVESVIDYYKQQKNIRTVSPGIETGGVFKIHF